MINKKKIGALVLAGTMLLSMGTGVFAAENIDIPNVNGQDGVKITKDFVMADGLAIPQATFKFQVKSKTPDALSATIQDISYDANDIKIKQTDGSYVISKDQKLSFEGNWQHAGEYVYKVTETQDPANKVENVTYDSSEYTLRVYVVNKNDNLEVEKITAEKAGTKTAKILFTNTYAKNDATLTIEKKTTGKYANKTKKFNFEITFTKSPMSDQTTFTGNIGSEPVECTAGIEKPFTLADGEQLVFHDLPVGTTYVVKELAAKDGYTPSVTVKENQTNTVTNKTVQETEALNTLKENGKNNLVGENENKVTFTNTYKDVAVTGIVMNNLPFILLVAVAIVAFVSLAVIKRRRTSGK